jgi:hypothetical protein
MRTTFIALLSSVVVAAPLAAQDGGLLYAGGVLAGSPTRPSWRLTGQKDLSGLLGVDGSFLVLPGVGPGAGDLYGFGGDLTLLSAQRGVPTVFAGFAGGIGVGGTERLWGAASFGVRMPILIVGPMRLMAEGRYKSYTFDGRTGIEAGLALGFRSRRHDIELQPEGAGLYVLPPIAEILRARGIPEAKAQLLGNVVRTALDEMGQPYVWGGTGDGNGGFDCSGLIQFAYGRYGIPIPRTSAGQADAGIAMRRDQEGLLPGDILVFSERGDEPTHVGLYVGEGKFIHSASKGVRLSRLADDDTEGRLWLRRWIGVRRIVE